MSNKLKQRHIAFIPARKGSAGFPEKNRLFFDRTAQFIQSTNLFDEVIVSTNDEIIKEKAMAANLSIHHRNVYLSGPEISIRQVAENMIEEMKIGDNDYIWLFFIPFLYHNVDDFAKTKKLVKSKNIISLCSFIQAKSHPYDCWAFDQDKGKLTRYIDNDVFRRQDKPLAWEHYHYLACFQAKIVSSLNHELIYQDTYPVFLDEETTKKLVEIDCPQDYEKWKERHGEED